MAEINMHTISLAKAFVVRKRLSKLIKDEENLLEKVQVYTFAENEANARSMLTTGSISGDLLYLDKLLTAKAALVKEIESVNITGQMLLADIARVDEEIHVDTRLLERLNSATATERVFDTTHGTYVVTELTRIFPEACVIKQRITEATQQKGILEDSLAKFNADTTLGFVIDDDLAKNLGI